MSLEKEKLDELINYIDERVVNLKMMNYFEKSDTLYSFFNFNAILYNRIVELLTHDVTVFVIRYIKSLFLEKGILLKDNPYLSINIKENKNKLWYEFRPTLDEVENNKMKFFIEKHKEMTELDNLLVFVFLNVKNPYTEEMLAKKYRRLLYDVDVSKINFIFFEDFVEENFGCDKFIEFTNAFKYLEEKCKELIGFDVTEICTLKAKDKFKKDHLFALLDADNYAKSSTFRQLKPNDKNNIINNYEKNKEVLLKEYSFSKSLFTSEWVFSKYKSFENLDKTFVVAGYLKSIEQLLSSIILVKGNGKKIDTFDGTMFVDDIVNSDATYINASLNHFRKFINYQMFDRISIEMYSLKIISDKLKYWIDKVRNGYFHKDNLDRFEIVVEIRNETYQLLFYILGCFPLSKEEKLKLV